MMDASRWPFFQAVDLSESEQGHAMHRWPSKAIAMASARLNIVQFPRDEMNGPTATSWAPYPSGPGPLMTTKWTGWERNKSECGFPPFPLTSTDSFASKRNAAAAVAFTGCLFDGCRLPPLMKQLLKLIPVSAGLVQ
jgi:hypothetical protein